MYYMSRLVTFGSGQFALGFMLSSIRHLLFWNFLICFKLRDNLVNDMLGYVCGELYCMSLIYVGLFVW